MTNSPKLSWASSALRSCSPFASHSKPLPLHLEIQRHRGNPVGLIRSSFREHGKVKHSTHGRITGLALEQLKLLQAAATLKEPIPRATSLPSATIGVASGVTNRRGIALLCSAEGCPEGFGCKRNRGRGGKNSEPDLRLTALLQPHLSPIRADPGQLNQLILNLAVNARDAMPQGGSLTLETHEIDLNADDVKANIDFPSWLLRGPDGY